MNRASGYSLIEILVVTVIIVGLVLGGMASYNKYNRRQKVRTAAEQIVQDLLAAKKQVMSGDTSVCLNNETLNGFQVAFTNGGNSYAISATCNITPRLDSTKTLSGVTTTTTNTVNFLSNGQAAASYSVGVRLNASCTATVTVSTQGEVKVNTVSC